MKRQPKTANMKELSPLITGLIADGTDVQITVTGNSMSPLFRSCRDTVTLTKCEPSALKRLDIPLYIRDDGTYVLHRIIKVNKDTYNMAGDNQTVIEKNVKKENVLCVVKGFTRKGKYHSCDEIPYRLYSFFWSLSVKLRAPVFWIHRLPGKIFKGR